MESEEYATLTVTGQQSVVAPSAPTVNPIYNPSKPGQKPPPQTELILMLKNMLKHLHPIFLLELWIIRYWINFSFSTSTF